MTTIPCLSSPGSRKVQLPFSLMAQQGFSQLLYCDSFYPEPDRETLLPSWGLSSGGQDGQQMGQTRNAGMNQALREKVGKASRMAFDRQSVRRFSLEILTRPRDAARSALILENQACPKCQVQTTHNRVYHTYKYT